MQILDNLLIIALHVLAFVYGKHIADKYNAARIEELEFQLRLLSAERGVGYVQPPKRYMPIGQQFMDRLKTNGRATQKFSPSDVRK